MSVPRCKECEAYRTEPIRDYSSAMERWCHVTWLLPKYITGNEARTSPKWCPKRLKESE